MSRLEDLPPKMRKAVVAAMAKDGQTKLAARSRKQAPASTSMLRCVTCSFTDNRPTVMDRHCDRYGHHRYETVIDV